MEFARIVDLSGVVRGCLFAVDSVIYLTASDYNTMQLKELQKWWNKLACRSSSSAVALWGAVLLFVIALLYYPCSEYFVGNVTLPLRGLLLTSRRWWKH